MFKYINMPKLVAYYLKEFSTRTDGQPSAFYQFIFCLCLPFISSTFNEARMIALGIAECTNSRDQISRLLNKITGATVTFDSYQLEYFLAYDGSQDATVIKLPYNNSANGDVPLVPVTPIPSSGNMIVNLNGYDQAQFESYASLLIPFYINFTITYV